jgi:hypothetical protein
MATDLKRELHALIDGLGEKEIGEAFDYLRWLAAGGGSPRPVDEPPIDDEPETDEERAAVANALEQLQRGDIVSHAEVRRDLGL